MHVFLSAALDHPPGSTPLSAGTRTSPVSARQRLLRGGALDGYHLDIGTPDSYARLNNMRRSRPWQHQQLSMSGLVVFWIGDTLNQKSTT